MQIFLNSDWKYLEMQKTETANLDEWKFDFGEGGLSPSTFIDSLA